MGATADIGSGEIGQRVRRTGLTADADPLGRISARVQNRVQNRSRNRCDRFDDPQANATTPFAVACEPAAAAGRPRGYVGGRARCAYRPFPIQKHEPDACPPACPSAG